MASMAKRFRRLLDAPSNVRFGELATIVEAFGFTLIRVSGGHHIFAREGIVEQINLQNVNGKAKPYQVGQFLRLVERYNLTLEAR